MSLSYKVKYLLNGLILLLFSVSLRFKPARFDNASIEPDAVQSSAKVDDGFDFLRVKRALEGRVDQILNREKDS